MKKDLDFYMNLPYTMEVTPIAESLGGGYTATLPQIGKYAVSADGETPEEAISNLNGVKRERFKHYLEQGISLPEPETDTGVFSGRFVVRIPKVLHKHLSLTAEKNSTSLNQYVAYLLSANLALDQIQHQINEQHEAVVERLGSAHK